MKLKYILKKLKTFQYKEFFKIINKIHKITKKPRIIIMIDIIKCTLTYGSGYMDYFEFEFYLLNKEQRKTYLTGSINNDIIKKYNDKNYWHCFSDKIEFNNLFKDYLGRKYLDLRSSSLKDFENFIKKEKYIIVKPIDDCGGHGVEVIDINEKFDLEKTYNKLKENKQFLVEQYIEQNKELSKLYPDSVNSLRVLTFVDDEGKCRIMNVILKIGNNGRVDNFSSGGMYTFLNEEGIVYVPAIDEKGNKFTNHPITNEKIVGFKMPNYDQLQDFCDKLTSVVKKVRYVGWDIVSTKDKLIVIEGNEYPGVFQVKPSMDKTKTGAKPKYQKYMDI